MYSWLCFFAIDMRFAHMIMSDERRYFTSSARGRCLTAVPWSLLSAEPSYGLANSDKHATIVAVSRLDDHLGQNGVGVVTAGGS